jgi:NACalpha-BTF3-like transcription factor
MQSAGVSADEAKKALEKLQADCDAATTQMKVAVM